MIEKSVRLLVLGSSNVSSHDCSWLKSNINHHLEHIRDIIFNAMSLEIHLFLVVVHSHISSGHLNHTVVKGLIGVLQGLKVGVLQSKKGAGGLCCLISGSDVNHEAHMNGSWETLVLSQYGESVVELSHIVFTISICSLNRFVSL